jgi:hypothetical protein
MATGQGANIIQKLTSVNEQAWLTLGKVDIYFYFFIFIFYYDD